MQLRPLRVPPRSNAGSILSSPPLIYPVLPRWKPRAEPLPSPGDRPELRLHHGLEQSGTDQDRSLGPLHSPVLPACSFLWGSSFLPPAPQASFRPTLLVDRAPGFSHSLARDMPPPYGGTQGQSRTLDSLPLPPLLSEAGDSSSVPSWNRPIRAALPPLIGHLQGAGLRHLRTRLVGRPRTWEAGGDFLWFLRRILDAAGVVGQHYILPPALLPLKESLGKGRLL